MFNTRVIGIVLHTIVESNTKCIVKPFEDGEVWFRAPHDSVPKCNKQWVVCGCMNFSFFIWGEEGRETESHIYIN